jgi:tryptophan synthase beta chain
LCYTRVTAACTNNAKIDIPKQWYNIVADLDVKPPPSLHPQTHKPLNPEDLSPLFAEELIKQEISEDRYIDIPEEIIDVYQLWRPTPLIRYMLTWSNNIILDIKTIPV